MFAFETDMETPVMIFNFFSMIFNTSTVYESCDPASKLR